MSDGLGWVELVDWGRNEQFNLIGGIRRHMSSFQLLVAHLQLALYRILQRVHRRILGSRRHLAHRLRNRITVGIGPALIAAIRNT